MTVERHVDQHQIYPQTLDPVRHNVVIMNQPFSQTFGES